jgi:pimeloyl-ACP methyl ester carboxylesterase
VAELIIRHLGGRRVVLAGHSLGGPVIMAFAERHPDVVADQIAGVALVATSAAHLGHDLFGLAVQLTAPVVLGTRAVAKLHGLSRARVNLRHPGLIAGFIRAGFYGPGAATAHNRRRTAAQVGRAHPAATSSLVSEMVHHDRRHCLAELGRTPVAVLAGTRDGLCPLAHSRAIADAMPHAELVVYPGAGHMLPFERPAEVAAQLAALAGRTAGLAAVPVETASAQGTSKTAGS